MSPSIAIDQKTTSKNPRSTVGTVTEIYDYLRLLFARIGIPYCPVHKKPIKRLSVEEMTNQVLELETGTKLEILAPISKEKKNEDLLDNLLKSGFTKVKINGENFNIGDKDTVVNLKEDTIEVIIDRIVLRKEERGRIFEAIETSLSFQMEK